MAIKSIIVGNFKGVNGKRTIALKPITIFIGPNSSGKSSCIHALAALSQTLKITNNQSPLILDDEYADVHLGRFVDVVHSGSYADAITLGINIEGFFVRKLNGNKATRAPAALECEFQFRATKRTQEIHLVGASITIGIGTDSPDKFALTRRGSDYILEHGASGAKIPCQVHKTFGLDFLNQVQGEDDFKKLNPFLPLMTAQAVIAQELSCVRYLGPFRQPPRRLYPTRGAIPREVGALGEATVPLLANEIIQSQARKHIGQIESWLGELGVARKLDVRRSGRSDLFGVSLTLQDNKEFSIADLGYGLSQVLPVLVQCSFADNGCTLLFEQPEIHLHTIAARALAGVFIQTARRTGSAILVETHSPELLKEFFARIRKKELSLDHFVCYRVSRNQGETQITPIDIDPDDCDVNENWEKGISIP